MKPNFTLLILTLVFSLFILSCSKDVRNERQQYVEAPQTLNATVQAGGTYSFSSGMGTTLSITKQASHFEISEVAATENGNIAYKYTAAKGFVGTDEVTLLQTTMSTTPGGGCQSGHGEQTTTMKTLQIIFNVSN